MIFYLCIGTLSAQINFQGNVKNQDGVALAFASIGIKGSVQGSTFTDSNGDFTVSANSGDTLEVYYIGYQNFLLVLGSELDVHIVLSETKAKLNELVIIGYGTSKRKDLTGSVAQVSSKNFNSRFFNNPMQQIQGKVSGVQITTDNGQPGGATTIKIRGNSALTGTGQPLFVVDGTPLDGRTLQGGVNGLDGSNTQTGVSPLNFLNPDDISSIEILKDASASAIYGSRAAYGVVLINTKKAEQGKPRLNVSMVTGVAHTLKKVNILNATQYRNAIQYYNLDPALDKGGSADAYGAILRKAVQQNFTIEVAGGDEYNRYRLSSNLSDQQGIINNTGFKKYGINFNSNFKFLENKKLGLDIHAISSQSIQNVPFPEYSAVRLIIPTLNWNPTNPLRNDDGTLTKGTKDVPNPIELTEKLKNNFKTNTVLASLAPYYNFKDWLQYKLVLSINYSSAINRSWEHQDISTTTGGVASISNSELMSRQVTQTINFNKSIFNTFSLNALGGFEYMDFSMKGSSLKGTGAQGTGFGNFGLDYTNYLQYSGTGNRTISSFIDPTTALKSFLGRVTINYKERYLLTSTYRADGSSKFGDDHQYGFFPSFAVAWFINQESFFKSNKNNLLKLRMGWGKTGNQEFPSGASQSKYSFGDNGTLIQVNNPNPDLKWQSDNQYNIGLDFSIWKDRISGTVDYFKKTTTDLLFPSPPIQPAPPSAVVRWVNLNGKIKNKGLEVSCNGALIDRAKCNWDLNANITFLNNVVQDIPAPVYTGFIQGPVQIIQNNLPMQAFYTRKYLGLDKTTGLSNYQDNGAVFYYVGDPNPKTLLGLSSIFRYHNLSLTTTMYGALGQDIYNATLMRFLNVGSVQGGNIALSVLNESVKESLANPVTPSSRYIMKGNYFKVSELTVAYALGDVAKTFKGINLRLTAQNLFMITKYPGFDPETNSNSGINGVPSLGIDYPHYPTARVFAMGIHFSL